MNLRLTWALLLGCGLISMTTGCHHYVSYHDRVWDGWCGSSAACDGGKGCVQKGVCQKGACQKGCGKGGKGGGVHVPLFSKLHTYFYCGNGCGEVYVGEWISDPPDCCDPCDAYYGCYTGPADCCYKKNHDPLLWLLKKKHKHCLPSHCEHGIPSSGCHWLSCDYYVCHPNVVCRSTSGKGCDKGGCGKGSCGKCSGGIIGGYVPTSDGGVSPPGSIDAIPMPVIGANPGDRVAAHADEPQPPTLRR